MSAPRCEADAREPNRPSLRRVLALGALWVSISAGALAAPGCYGRNCEGGLEFYGAETEQGRMVDENTWESGPMDGAWLPYPRQRAYIFDIRALGGRTPYSVEPYISASPEPMKNGGNATVGSGNLALLANVSPNRVDIRNDSCSDFYLRLVVHVRPQEPALPPEDDGGADAGTADAADDDAGNDGGI